MNLVEYDPTPAGMLQSWRERYHFVLIKSNDSEEEINNKFFNVFLNFLFCSGFQKLISWIVFWPVLEHAKRSIGPVNISAKVPISSHGTIHPL